MLTFVRILNHPSFQNHIMDLTPTEFELLLCEFCKQDLPPHFTVEHDVKEIGGESGGKRQIDTKIRGQLGISEILICGEAKNWGEAVGSETIDALVGKYFSGEIRANKVIVFSNQGYTGPAIQRAKALGIELLEPAAIGKAIKNIPYIVGIGRIKQMIFRATHKTPQHTVMALNLDDYTILKGRERISFRQNAFRILKHKLILMGIKDISTDLSKFSIEDHNVLYELKQKEGYHYTADFELTISIFWDYYIEYLPAGILRHINQGQLIFVNLIGHPFNVLQKVLLSPTKINYESKEEVVDNIINKSEGYVSVFCMPDPDKDITDPQNPIFSFV